MWLYYQQFGEKKENWYDRSAKDSFLRALREVAPEMELFLENHGQYIKKFVIKSLPIFSFQKDIPIIFLSVT